MTMVTNEPKVNTCQCGQGPYMRWLANNCRQLCCGTCGRRGVIGETAEVAAADWNRMRAIVDLLADNRPLVLRIEEALYTLLDPKQTVIMGGQPHRRKVYAGMLAKAVEDIITASALTVQEGEGQ